MFLKWNNLKKCCKNTIYKPKLKFLFYWKEPQDFLKQITLMDLM